MWNPRISSKQESQWNCYQWWQELYHTKVFARDSSYHLPLTLPRRRIREPNEFPQIFLAHWISLANRIPTPPTNNICEREASKFQIIWQIAKPTQNITDNVRWWPSTMPKIRKFWKNSRKEETKQRKYLGCTPGEEQNSMGGRGMDGLYDRSHYTIHGSLLFLALFFLALDSPRSHGCRYPKSLISYCNFKHEQPQTTTPSHLTCDTATSSTVKNCGRRIVRTINWRILARIEASKQFWMAMLWPWLICQPNSVFFFCEIAMNLPEIRMLGRGLGLGLGIRDQPLWPWPWQDVWP